MSIKLLVFFVYGFFLVLLSFFKTIEIFLPYIHALEAGLGGDKLMHLQLATLLTTLALLAFGSHASLKKKASSMTFLQVAIRGIFVCLIIASGLLADELLQSMVSTRRFEWSDFNYGASGIAASAIIYVSSCALYAIFLRSNEEKVGNSDFVG